jgi:hypothetical protein
MVATNLPAAVSETATRLVRPRNGAAFGASVAIASLAVFVVGAWRIRRDAPALVGRFAPRAPVA